MNLLAILVLAASPSAREVSIPLTDGRRTVRVECPVNQTTRIVFPDRFLGVKATADVQQALGVLPVASSPRGVLRISPPSHPARGTVRIQDPSGTLVLVLETVPRGPGSEIRLSYAKPAPATPAPPPAQAARAPVPAPAPAKPAETEAAATPSPAAEEAKPLLVQSTAPSPAPEPPSLPSPEPAPLPTTAASAPPVVAAPAPPALDLAGLLRAQPSSIGRREGLPGQRPFTLVDALRGEQWVWLRLRLQGGAADTITKVALGTEPVETFVQEADGKDLRLIVQLPKTKVSKKSRLIVRAASSGEYRFALNSPTFTSFLKNLF